MKRAKGAPGARDGVPPAYLTRSDVARLFGVSPATVASWARQGRLGYISTLGGHRRYPRDHVLALLHEVTIQRAPRRGA